MRKRRKNTLKETYGGRVCFGLGLEELRGVEGSDHEDSRRGGGSHAKRRAENIGAKKENQNRVKLRGRPI